MTEEQADFQEAYAFDSGVSASDKFVSVSNGSRRLELPDGEGYLQAVETSPSNGLPDGRYDLSKAIEAKRQADRSYDGQVLHSDNEGIYQLVGKEIIKHGMFEAAKRAAPEIGKQISIAYTTGVPTLLQATHGSITKEAASVNVDKQATRQDASADLKALFRQDPRSVSAEAVKEDPMLAQIATRTNASGEYATEVNRRAPDLFAKLANPDTKQIVHAIEIAERADQAKTVADKLGGESEGRGERRAKDGTAPESERRGFTTPNSLATSVEARVGRARDMMNSIHTLEPMYARRPKAMVKQTGKQEQQGQAPTVKKKRGMSR